VTRGADLVIVGGGIVGAAAAYEAARAGATTVLIDREDPGRATDAGAGILSPETTGNPDDDWYTFALAAAEHYRRLVPELEDATGLPTGYAPCGALCLALHRDEMPWYQERVELAARRGAPLLEITIDEAVARFPPLRPMAAALYNSSAARIDGRSMARALRAAAAGAGASLVTAGVTDLRTQGDRVTEVCTTGEDLSCGAVLVAGGAWTSEFERVLRFPLPVVPMKGQIVHLRLDGTDGARAGEWPIVQPVANYYLVPWEDGRVVCGGTLEPDAGFDTRPTAMGVYQLLREALRMAPGLRGAALGDVRVGLRPAMPDDAPALGRVPGWSNAFVATGHGTEGLLLGPYSSRLVVGQALGGAGADGRALGAFAPDRFAR
jgi:D-amino-acid dehydrogenase